MDCSVVVEEIFERVIRIELVQVVFGVEVVRDFGEGLPCENKSRARLHLIPHILRAKIQILNRAGDWCFLSCIVLGRIDNLIVLVVESVVDDRFLGKPCSCTHVAADIKGYGVLRVEVNFGGAFGGEVLECVKCNFFVETEAEVAWDFAPSVHLLLFNWCIFGHCVVTGVFHGGA